MLYKLFKIVYLMDLYKFSRFEVRPFLQVWTSGCVEKKNNGWVFRDEYGNMMYSISKSRGRGLHWKGMGIGIAIRKDRVLGIHKGKEKEVITDRVIVGYGRLLWRVWHELLSGV